MIRAQSIAVCVGRFQPVHSGHLQLIEYGLSQADQLLLVVGSAFRAPTPRNPFSWTTRAAMLEQALADRIDLSRVRIVPIRDYFNIDRWANELVRLVQDFHQSSGKQNSEVKLLIDSAEAAVLQHPVISTWQYDRRPKFGAINSAFIRDHLFQSTGSTNPQMNVGARAEPLQTLEEHLDKSTLEFLRQWLNGEQFHELSQEWHHLQQYRQAWNMAPYPPIFVTADCVVRCQERVLLVQRARIPGKGLWALPGGFIEPDELILNSALRELREETNLEIENSELRQVVQSSIVCDHPLRSERGRVITHAFLFDLGNRQLPSVTAADDAMQATWVEIDQLTKMEDQFHDDHFMILDRFLGLV